MPLVNLFSISICRDQLPNFSQHKQVMIDAARRYKDENPNDTHSNLNGYQSPKLLHSLPEFTPLFDYLTFCIQKTAKDLGLSTNIGISEAWVNFNSSRECMNHQHIHGGILSGVVYLLVPPNSGKLYIANPGMNCIWEGYTLCNKRNQYTSEAIQIPPEEGMILIWPSFLPHGVGTNRHDEERISIAFNTTFTES